MNSEDAATKIENQPRGDFIIRGLPQELREKFSKRHSEIDEKTRELLAREPQKAAGNVAEIRENIAHNERSRKIRDIGAERLKELWERQLAAGEGRADAKHRRDRATSADSSEASRRR